MLLLSVRCTTQEKELTINTDIKDSIVTIENDTITAVFSMMGGILFNIHEKANNINPFACGKTTDTKNTHSDVIQKGHYICLGRFGSLSPGEAKQGMPQDGELCNNLWKVSGLKGFRNIKMTCDAPLDGIYVTREITLSSVDPIMKITETYANELSIGHPISIGQCSNFCYPFMDSSSRIFTNATFGYLQKSGNPSQYDFTWPKAVIDTLQEAIDLSTNYYHNDFSSSNVILDSLGWVTVANPKMNILIGYLWKAQSYPWLNISQSSQYLNIPIKKIGFGTTGLADSLPVSQKLTTIFHGIRNFEFIDAKDNFTKNYYCFFIHLPSGYIKTVSVNQQSETVIVQLLISGKVKEFRLSI